MRNKVVFPDCERPVMPTLSTAASGYTKLRLSPVSEILSVAYGQEQPYHTAPAACGVIRAATMWGTSPEWPAAQVE
jgi:hypothetical protein